MHTADRRAFSHLEKALGAIEAVEAFALEFDTSELEQVDTSAYLMFPDGETLTDYLGERSYRRVYKHLLRQTGLDISYYRTYKPFWIIQAVDQLVLASEGELSLDEYLEREARAMGKKVLGIETLSEQLQVLSGLSLEWQMKMLVSLSRNVPQYRREMHHLAELYVRGDVRQLYRSGKKRLGPHRELMLYRRNRVMAGRINSIAGHQTLFAAVGAAHLSGKFGLIALLKAEGWRCRPV